MPPRSLQSSLLAFHKTLLRNASSQMLSVQTVHLPVPMHHNIKFFYLLTASDAQNHHYL